MGDRTESPGDATRRQTVALLRRYRFDGYWLALCWVPYALLTLKFRFLCDDAFISFRYARNWATGHGLRFNLGEHVPVEGYSNFLWVCLAALGELANVPPTVLMPMISFVAGTVLLIIIFFILRRRFEFPLVVAVPACLFLACCPSMAIWSTSGLETMPFALLILVTFQRVILRRDGPAGVTGGLAALTLALMRVDGIEWAVLIGLIAIGVQCLRSDRSFKPFITYFIILVVGYGSYFVCRYAYYESLLPNTVHVKVRPSIETLVRGCKYVAVFYLTLLAPLAALLGLPVALAVRRRRSLGIPVALLALAFPAYAVVVGGDFMTMGRLLVPGLVFHAVLLALLLEPLAGRGPIRRGLCLVVGLAVVTIGILPAWDVHLVPESVRARLHFRLNTEQFRSELAQWEFMSDNVKRLTELAKVLREVSKPGESLVIDMIGAVGYYADLFVYDLYGLVSPEVTRADRAGRLHSPGHDLRVPPTFFLAYKPTYLNWVLVPAGQAAGAIMRTWAARWASQVDVNQYAPQIVNTSRITGNPRAPLFLFLRLPPSGDSAEEMWSRFRSELRLWSM